MALISLKRPGGAASNQVTGANNGSFEVIGTRHTGRISRKCETISVTGVGVDGSKSITVLQAASTVFVSAQQDSIANQPQDSLSAAVGGGEVVFSGWSNSNKLKAEWVANAKGHTTWNLNGNGTDNNGNSYSTPALPTQFYLEDISTNVTAAFNDDMEKAGNATVRDAGKTSQYKFMFKINFPKNPDNDDRLTRQLKITDLIGNTSVIFTIEQDYGASTLTVSVTSITLNAAGDALSNGNAATVSVTSNTNWTASVGQIPT